MNAYGRIFSVATTIALIAIASPAFAQVYVGGSGNAAVEVDLDALNSLPGTGPVKSRAVKLRHPKTLRLENHQAIQYDSELETTIVGGGGKQLAELSDLKPLTRHGAVRHGRVNRSRQPATTVVQAEPQKMTIAPAAAIQKAVYHGRRHGRAQLANAATPLHDPLIAGNKALAAHRDPGDMSADDLNYLQRVCAIQPKPPGSAMDVPTRAIPVEAQSATSEPAPASPPHPAPVPAPGPPPAILPAPQEEEPAPAQPAPHADAEPLPPAIKNNLQQRKQQLAMVETTPPPTPMPAPIPAPAAVPAKQTPQPDDEPAPVQPAPHAEPLSPAINANLQKRKQQLAMAETASAPARPPAPIPAATPAILPMPHDYDPAPIQSVPAAVVEPSPPPAKVKPQNHNQLIASAEPPQPSPAPMPTQTSQSNNAPVAVQPASQGTIQPLPPDVEAALQRRKQQIAAEASEPSQPAAVKPVQPLPPHNQLAELTPAPTPTTEPATVPPHGIVNRAPLAPIRSDDYDDAATEVQPQASAAKPPQPAPVRQPLPPIVQDSQQAPAPAQTLVQAHTLPQKPTMTANTAITPQPTVNPPPQPIVAATPMVLDEPIVATPKPPTQAKIVGSPPAAPQVTQAAAVVAQQPQSTPAVSPAPQQMLLDMPAPVKAKQPQPPVVKPIVMASNDISAASPETKPAPSPAPSIAPVAAKPAPTVTPDTHDDEEVAIPDAQELDKPKPVLVADNASSIQTASLPPETQGNANIPSSRPTVPSATPAIADKAAVTEQRRPASPAPVTIPASPQIQSAPVPAPEIIQTASLPPPPVVPQAAPAKPEPAALKAPNPPAPTGDLPLHIDYQANSSDPSSGSTARLDALVARLQSNGDLRVELRSFASGGEGGPSKARRLSLSRALAIRSYLTSRGVDANRIDLRALGAAPDQAGADRIDFFLVR